jgi:hypothetical protein
LHLDPALDGINGARELDQHTIAGGLDDAAVVRGNLGVDQLGAMRLECRERPRFVGLHQPRVSHHVGGKDGSKPAFNALLGHGAVFSDIGSSEGILCASDDQVHRSQMSESGQQGKSAEAAEMSVAGGKADLNFGPLHVRS